MLTLAIDSATEACSVALFDNAALIAGSWQMLGRGHAERLVPMIAALPGRGRAVRIAVSLGPGSFTGLRVGLASARALALAWGAELVGYSTPALLAAMARDSLTEPTAVAAATTGGHGEWFVQRFAQDGVPADDPMSMRPQDAIAKIREPIIVGSQAEALVAGRGHGTAVPLWPDARAFPLLSPASLTADLRPLYGREPDARLPGARA